METQKQESERVKSEGKCGDTADGKFLSVVCLHPAGHSGDHWCPAGIWPQKKKAKNPKTP